MKKLPIDYLRTLGTTVGDVYFPQTKLLLPFDGTNGATTTSDLSNSNHTVTFNGNASLSTTQSKFGGSSASFDGTGDSLSFDASSSWEFGTGDFTIEFWVRFGAGSVYHTMWDYGYTSNGSLLIQTTNDSPPKMRIFVDYGRTSAYITDSTSVSLNTWYHYAIVRSSGTVTIYRDGVSTVSGSMTGSIDAGSAPTIGIKAGTSNYALNGYLDDFRITKAVARYTSNFTAPTSAHLTSAGDVNKQIIVNSAADGVAIGTGGINQARIAKAWVNFNGTGTVAINGSYNVSSITDDGVGDYDINFSTALSDTNYVVVGTTGGSSIVGFKRDQNETRTTSKAGVYSLSGSQALADGPYIEAIVFGN